MEKRGGTHDTQRQNKLFAAWLRLYEGPDNFYLNYYGPAGTIPTIPYHALVGQGASAGAFGNFDLNGKVVFVGHSDLVEPSKEDGYDTVFTRSDGVQLSGVEIIATAFANLLTGNNVEPVGPLIAGAIVFALGLAAFAGAYFLPPAMGLILALGLAVIHAIAAQMLFSSYNIWLPLATPLLIQVPLAFGLGLHAQSTFARRRYKRMQRAVGYYVPSRLARELIDDRADPTATSRTVDAACLTAVAENLTRVVEGMMPQAAAAYLNAYFEALAEPLKRHQVDVTDFRNDGSLSAWTCPERDEAVRLRACLAALETLDAVDGFNQRNAPLHLDVHLGMHAGQVFIGHTGASEHLRYSIIGDVAATVDHIAHLNRELGTRLGDVPLRVEICSAGVTG